MGNWLISHHRSHILSLAWVTGSISHPPAHRWTHSHKPTEMHPTDGKKKLLSSSPGLSLALSLLRQRTPFIPKKRFSGINRDCVNRWPLKNLTLGVLPLSQLHSCWCPVTKGTHKEAVESNGSQSTYSDSYKTLKSGEFMLTRDPFTGPHTKSLSWFWKTCRSFIKAIINITREGYL